MLSFVEITGYSLVGIIFVPNPTNDPEMLHLQEFYSSLIKEAHEREIPLEGTPAPTSMPQNTPVTLTSGWSQNSVLCSCIANG